MKFFSLIRQLFVDLGENVCVAQSFASSSFQLDFKCDNIDEIIGFKLSGANIFNIEFRKIK
ncbi:hypothetical protein [Chryseobacterium luquanense]|uniref:Uncharacterized protein n=1 Tax=Chryseobacterium luquanense TaxID=2983766 RepID=A0ABT3XY57_9FLAO|nr:hypothetical protein [Chryseobacterium luquanense]MCX8530829.1 hypothetical protein [Chryseobacterium luquanense]